MQDKGTLPVDPAGLVKKDKIVYLGTKGVNRMEYPLRLIETEGTQGKPIIIIIKTGYKGSLLNIDGFVNACLYEAFTVFVQKLYHKPQRSLKG